MVSQDAYFSLLTHAKQLLLVTLCETTAGKRKNESVTYGRTYARTDGRTHVRTDGRTYGRTDRREV